MKWQIMPGKEKQIKLITDELKKADAVYLASDPDREGEAIAWHLLDILKNKNAPLFDICDYSAVERLLYEERIEPWYGQLMTTPQTVAYMIMLNYWLEKFKVKIV